MVTGSLWVLEYVSEIRLTRPARKLDKTEEDNATARKGRLIRKYMNVLAEFEMPLKMSTKKGWKDGSIGKHTCCQA